MTAVPVKVRARAPLRRALGVSPWIVALIATGIAGIALRVWVYRSAAGYRDADEAVVGLVARHMLHGDFATFTWGQAYGGTQEELLTVPVFFAFGSSWLAMRIVPMVLSALAALLVWRVGRRTIGEPAASVAGALFWIWPGYNLIKLTHQHGFYASGVVYCALLLLLGLRVVERPTALRVGLLGLVVGLALWETGQVVPIAVPVLVWTAWKQPRALRKLWAAVPLAALGALPWIVWNVRHDWASLDVTYGAQSSYPHRLRIFLSPLLPMVVGLRQPWTQVRLLPAALTLLIYAVLAALFVLGAIRSRGSNASLLYTAAAAFPFLYAISEWTIEAADPRYLVILTPLLALLAAQLATRYWRGAVLIALACALALVVVHRKEQDELAAPQTGPPRNFKPLIAELDRLGVTRAYSSYWVAYRLAFESNERIIAVKNDFTGVNWDGTQAQPVLGAYIRYPPYERAVRAGRHAFVLYRVDVPTSPVAPKLVRYGYRRHDVGSLAVYVLPPR